MDSGLRRNDTEEGKTMTQIPTISRGSAPSNTPVSLTEAKAHLRVAHTSEDAQITGYINAATYAAERFLRRSLITQGWVLSFDDYAASEVSLPRGPVQTISSVNLIARDGVSTTVASSSYYIKSDRETIAFDAAPFSHRVEIHYVAGYGVAADVPEPIRQGILQHIAQMYGERSGHVPVSSAIRSLYEPFRKVFI
jgi:uncharacterized phiE125 gp8 family phage protein